MWRWKISTITTPTTAGTHVRRHNQPKCWFSLWCRIFNDVITLRKGSGFMWVGWSILYSSDLTPTRTKLSLSHALAQSVKISLVRLSFPFKTSMLTSSQQFEELISSTIEQTKDVPEIISETGKVGMPQKRAFFNTNTKSWYSRNWLQKLCNKSESCSCCG